MTLTTLGCLELRNNIILAQEKAVFADGPIKLGANVVWNSSGDPFVQIKTISDVANSPFIIANPSFVNAREGNVRLTATSPALNSADGSGTTVRDIDGRSVPATRRDIGAFER